MGSLSDYLENELLDHVLGVGAYTPPATVYIGYSTADPLDTGAGIAEPGAGNYGRQACAFGAAAARMISNSGLITFAQANGAQGTITHWFICDHATNVTWGTNVNMLAHGALAVQKGIVAGNTPSFAIGEIDISFSANEVSDYLAIKFLDFAFRNQAFAQPTISVGLATADLSDSTTGATVTECANANNYARKAHAAWVAASGGASSNNGDITFNAPSGSWGLVTAAFLADSATHGAGNILFYENTITEQTPTSGDTVKFPSGDLDIALT
jgi:hypothetical protein